MNLLSKVIAIAAIGTAVIAAGSFLALRGSEAATAASFPTVPYTTGFATATGWSCASNGPSNGVLTFRDRWSGVWELAASNLPSFTSFTTVTWAACTNGWAHGYLNLPANRPITVAQAPRINLSTLPLMR